MLSIPLAIAVFFLGIRGFTQAGIPLTRHKHIRGTAGKIAGSLCLLFSLVLLADGLFSLAPLIKSWQARARMLNPEPVTPGRSKFTIWLRYKIGDYGAVLPGSPSVERIEPTPALGIIRGKVLTSLLDDDVYQITHTQHRRKPQELTPLLDQLATQLADELSGKLRTQSVGALDDLPTLDLLYDLRHNMVARVRYVFDGTNRYQLMAVVHSGAESSPTTNEFFNAFSRPAPSDAIER